MVALLNLGMLEIGLILVVAVLVFGRDLPSAAVQAAGTLQKLRRALADMRRETGIDEELRRARREFEQAVPRDAARAARPTRVEAPRVVEHKPAVVVEPAQPPEAQPPAPPSSPARPASGEQPH